MYEIFFNIKSPSDVEGSAGYPLGPSYFTEDDFSGLVDNGSVTTDNYSEQIQIMLKGVQKLKYTPYIKGVSTQSMQAKIGYLPDNQVDRLDISAAEGATQQAFNSAQWQDVSYVDGVTPTGGTFIQLDGDGKVNTAYMYITKGQFSLNMKDQSGSAQLFLTILGDDFSHPPVPADGKWHSFGMNLNAGSSSTPADMIGDDSGVAFSPQPGNHQPAWGDNWFLAGAIPLLTVQPRTSADNDKCCQNCCGVDPSNSGFFSSNKCVQVQISLGNDRSGVGAGSLSLYSETPTPALATRDFLTCNASDIKTDENGAIRQVVVGGYFESSVLVDITDLTLTAGKGYQVNFYNFQGATYGNNGLVTPSGTPFKVITVEDPVGDGTSLQVSAVVGSVTRTDTFTWNPQSNNWTLLKNNDLTSETPVITWNSDQSQRTEVREIDDINGSALSKVVSVYAEYAFGERQISQVVDPNGKVLTTTWNYYTDADADGPSYGQLKSISNPTGNWVVYTYDSQGRLYRQFSPFQNGLPTTDPSQCRVETHTYSGSNLLGYTEAIVLSVQGTEIGRQYVVTSSSGYTIQNIVCTQIGAAISDASNLITTTNYTFFDGSRRMESVQKPDGTTEIYQYQTVTVASPFSVGLMTTVSSGARSGMSIVDGTRTTTVVDGMGNFAFSQTMDIASGQILTASSATATDSFGHPTIIQYSDGTSIQTQYTGCCGQQASVTDQYGITTSYTYDVCGNVLSMSRAGITVLYTYDGLNRVLTQTRQGNGGGETLQIQNTYNLAGQLISTVNAIGQTTTYAQYLNGAGYYEKDLLQPDGNTRTEIANADGSVRSIGGSAAHPVQYVYGVDGNGFYVQQIKGVEGTEWIKEYVDPAERPSMTVYADGTVASTSYNPLGQVAQTVDPDGVATTFTYDNLGRQATATIGGVRITQTIYSVTQRDDGQGNQTTVLEKTTNISAPSGGGLVTVSIVDQTPNGRESWVANYGLTTHTQTVLIPTSATSVQTTTAPDMTTRVVHHSLGRQDSVVDYDASGNSIASTTLTYDEFGRVQTSTDAATGVTTYSYTDLDEIASVSAPGGRTAVNEYNQSRRIDSIQFTDGSSQNFTFAPTGETTSQSGTETYNISYTYDSQGRPKTMTTQGTAGSETTTWNYSPTRGFLTSKTGEDGSGPSYQYTSAGRLAQRTWVRGVVCTYSYNGTGDLQHVSYSDGTTPAVNYTYDNQGHRISVTDGSGGRSVGYTADGKVTNETYTSGLLSGLSATRGYDSLLRRSALSLATPGQSFNQQYGYDGASRIQAINAGHLSAGYTYVQNTSLVDQTVLSMSGGATLTVSHGYDAAKRLTNIASTSSTAGLVASYDYGLTLLGHRRSATLADGSQWQYSYNPTGELLTGQHFWSDGDPAAGQQFAYSYDGIGNRTSTIINGRTASYTSNKVNEYTQRTNPGAVDVLGQALPGTTVTVNGTAPSRHDGYFEQTLSVANNNGPVYQPISVQGGASGQSTQQTGHIYVPPATETFSYDVDGNLTEDGRWQYTWDGENRLVDMQTTSAAVAAGIPREELAFAYDDQSRRVKKQVYTWAGGTRQLTKEIHFVYDAANMLAECDQNNNPIRHYVWGLDTSGTPDGAVGVGGLIEESQFSSSVQTDFLPAYDGNGNVVAFVQANDGHPRVQYEYGPFGEVLKATGVQASSHSFGWSTRYTDSESGIVQYPLRAYQPAIGRWLSRDPLQEKGGIALYLFVGNDPIDGMDPLGLFKLKKSQHFDTGYLNLILIWARLQIDADITLDVSPGVPKSRCPLKYPHNIEPDFSVEPFPSPGFGFDAHAGASGDYFTAEVGWKFGITTYGDNWWKKAWNVTTVNSVYHKLNSDLQGWYSGFDYQGKRYACSCISFTVDLKVKASGGIFLVRAGLVAAAVLIPEAELAQLQAGLRNLAKWLKDIPDLLPPPAEPVPPVGQPLPAL